MNISVDLNLPNPAQTLVYLLIAALVVATLTGLVRAHLGLAYLIVVPLTIAGEWLFAHLIKVEVGEGLNLGGVPLIEALLGGIFFCLLGLVVYGRGHSRRYT
ncbi:MAG TPA: hypothetical protein VH186_04820 [Chloroflexia bacterium]|nr:hypothetical protein [Chloroflexia bacterium]